VIDELPTAKSPIVADKIKPEELDEAVPPKRECWESRILKLSTENVSHLSSISKLKPPSSSRRAVLVLNYS